MAFAAVGGRDVADALEATSSAFSASAISAAVGGDAAVEGVGHRRAARGAREMGELPGGADDDAGIAGHRRHPQMQPRFSSLVLFEPGLVEMLEQPHVADRVQRDAAGQYQPVRAGRAQEMVDDMDHRVFQHQLRRSRLVETILGIGAVLDVLDAQHRIRIPQLLRLERLAEDVDQRRRVGIVRGIDRTSSPSRD